MREKYEFKGRKCTDCPTFFAYGTGQIESGKPEYPDQGYDDPAFHLTIHLKDFFEEDGTELAELKALVGKTNRYGIIQWFKWYLPEAMKLVPKKQHGSFLKGFWKGIKYEDLF